MTERKPEMIPTALCASTQVTAPTDRSGGTPDRPMTIMLAASGLVVQATMPPTATTNEMAAATSERAEVNGKIASVSTFDAATTHLGRLLVSVTVLALVSFIVVIQVLGAVMFMAAVELLSSVPETSFLAIFGLYPLPIAFIWFASKPMHRLLEGGAL